MQYYKKSTVKGCYLLQRTFWRIRCLLFAVLLSISCRRHLKDILKGSRKFTLAFVARLLRNFSHRISCIAQQPRSLMHAVFLHIRGYGSPIDAFENRLQRGGVNQMLF